MAALPDKAARPVLGGGTRVTRFPTAIATSPLAAVSAKDRVPVQMSRSWLEAPLRRGFCEAARRARWSIPPHQSCIAIGFWKRVHFPGFATAAVPGHLGVAERDKLNATLRPSKRSEFDGKDYRISVVAGVPIGADWDLG